MRAVIQRVVRASVEVDGATVGSIGGGLLILFAVEQGEDASDIDYLVSKIANLRIFNDEAGVMNRSLLDVGADALVVSQFTLFAQTRKGNRPSYIRSARGEVAEPLYSEFATRLSAAIGRPVPTGVFGADMQVSLVNDGPVTIIIDTRQRDL